MKILFFTCLFLLNHTINVDHDIHVSVTDIEITQDGKISVTSKIFFDDLQLAMGLQPGEELPKNYTNADQLIAKFVNKNLKLKLGKEGIKLQYLKSQASMPAVWASLSGYGKFDDRELVIENRIMTDIYEDQMNMVNITYKGKKQSHALNVKNTKLKITLQ